MTGIPFIPDWLPGWIGAGAAAGSGFGIIKWLAEYIGGRMDKRAAALDASTQRLIEGLENRLNAVSARLDHVEAELAECNQKHAEAEAQVMMLRAQMQGYAQADQRAQSIIAAERLADRYSGKDG